MVTIMPSTPSLVLAGAILIAVTSSCTADSNHAPPKFLRAARGVGKALYATRYGYSGIPIPGPRKLAVEGRLSRDVVSGPRSRYYRPSGYGRSRRRKTLRKPKKRHPFYSYGIPIYAQKFKYSSGNPHKRPSYKTKYRPRKPSYIRLPVYKEHHEAVEEPEDYEGEYDMRVDPQEHEDDDGPPKSHPHDAHHDLPPPPSVKKEKERKEKYSSKYKGQDVIWDEPPVKDTYDNGYRTIVERPPSSRPPSSRPPSSRPPSPRPPESHHSYQDEHETRSHWDTEVAYTQQPHSSYQSSRISPPPYVTTSNNYGGGRYNDHYSHFSPPASSSYRQKPYEPDIGYGQGMEVVDDSSPPWERFTYDR